MLGRNATSSGPGGTPRDRLVLDPTVAALPDLGRSVNLKLSTYATQLTTLGSVLSWHTIVEIMRAGETEHQQANGPQEAIGAELRVGDHCWHQRAA